MATLINKTSPVVPQTSDLIPIWQNANSDTRSTSISRLITLIEENLSLGKPATQYAMPAATDFDVEVVSYDQEDVHLIIDPTWAFADGAITLPTGPADKQTVLVNCTQDVTTFVVNSGKTVIGAPTGITAGDFFTLKYDLTFDTWYRVG